MTLELHHEDSWSHQRVAAGDIVTVRLPETPTTGYRWQPSYDEDRIRLVGDRFEGAADPRGAGGERVVVVGNHWEYGGAVAAREVIADIDQALGDLAAGR